MWFNLLFTALFIFAVYYLLRNSYKLSISVERSRDAVYPKTNDEFSNIIIAHEWKGMEPLRKDTKPFRFVQWLTAIAIVILGGLFVFVLTSDLNFSFLSVAYVFVAITLSVPHPGNFYIHSDGIILNGKFYSASEVKGYSVEKIIRWHELYGLSPKMNNGYKLTLDVKSHFFGPKYVVISELEELNKVEGYLHQLGIQRFNEEEKTEEAP